MRIFADHDVSDRNARSVCRDCKCVQSHKWFRKVANSGRRKKRAEEKAKKLEKSKQEGVGESGYGPRRRDASESPTAMVHSPASPASPGNALSPRDVAEECEIVAKPGADRCDPVACAARKEVSCSLVSGGRIRAQCVARGFKQSGVGEICESCTCRQSKARRDKAVVAACRRHRARKKREKQTGTGKQSAEGGFEGGKNQAVLRSMLGIVCSAVAEPSSHSLSRSIPPQYSLLVMGSPITVSDSITDLVIFANYLPHVSSPDAGTALARRFVQDPCKIVRKWSSGPYCDPAACAAHPWVTCALIDERCRGNGFRIVGHTDHICSGCQCRKKLPRGRPGQKGGSGKVGGEHWRATAESSNGKKGAQRPKVESEPAGKSGTGTPQPYRVAMAEMLQAASTPSGKRLSPRLVEDPCEIVPRAGAIYCNPVACAAEPWASCAIAKKKCQARNFDLTRSIRQICSHCLCLRKSTVQQRKRRRGKIGIMKIGEGYRSITDSSPDGKGIQKSSRGSKQTGEKSIKTPIPRGAMTHFLRSQRPPSQNSISPRFVEERCRIYRRLGASYCDPVTCGAQPEVFCTMRSMRCVAVGFSSPSVQHICKDCVCQKETTWRKKSRKDKSKKGSTAVKKEGQGQAKDGSLQRVVEKRDVNGKVATEETSGERGMAKIEEKALAVVGSGAATDVSPAANALSRRTVDYPCHVVRKTPTARNCDPMACTAMRGVTCKIGKNSRCNARGLNLPSTREVCSGCRCKRYEPLKKTLRFKKKDATKGEEEQKQDIEEALKRIDKIIDRGKGG